MTARRKAVYDTSFFATLYYSKNPDEKERLRRELAGRHAKHISAVSIYEAISFQFRPTAGRSLT